MTGKQKASKSDSSNGITVCAAQNPFQSVAEKLKDAEREKLESLLRVATSQQAEQRQEALRELAEANRFDLVASIADNSSGNVCSDAVESLAEFGRWDFVREIIGNQLGDQEARETPPLKHALVAAANRIPELERRSIEEKNYSCVHVLRYVAAFGGSEDGFRALGALHNVVEQAPCHRETLDKTIITTMESMQARLPKGDEKEVLMHQGLLLVDKLRALDRLMDRGLPRLTERAVEFEATHERFGVLVDRVLGERSSEVSNAFRFSIRALGRNITELYSRAMQGDEKMAEGLLVLMRFHRDAEIRTRAAGGLAEVSRERGLPSHVVMFLANIARNIAQSPEWVTEEERKQIVYNSFYALAHSDAALVTRIGWESKPQNQDEDRELRDVVYNPEKPDPPKVLLLRASVRALGVLTNVEGQRPIEKLDSEHLRKAVALMLAYHGCPDVCDACREIAGRKGFAAGESGEIAVIPLDEKTRMAYDRMKDQSHEPKRILDTVLKHKPVNEKEHDSFMRMMGQAGEPIRVLLFRVGVQVLGELAEANPSPLESLDSQSLKQAVATLLAYHGGETVRRNCLTIAQNHSFDPKITATFMFPWAHIESESYPGIGSFNEKGIPITHCP